MRIGRCLAKSLQILVVLDLFVSNPVSSYDVHYDDRYSRILLEDPEQREAIKVLVQTYLATFRDLGVQTWLMHGTLLGWWWGKKVLPTQRPLCKGSGFSF